MGGSTSAVKKLGYTVEYFPNPERDTEICKLPTPISPRDHLFSGSSKHFSVIVPYTRERFFVFSSVGYAQLYEYRKNS